MFQWSFKLTGPALLVKETLVTKKRVLIPTYSYKQFINCYFPLIGTNNSFNQLKSSYVPKGFTFFTLK